MVQEGKYGIYEISFKESGMYGAVIPDAAVFRCGGDEIKTAAYKAGKDIYKVRFMPVKEGVWDYIIRIGNKEITGSFECTENAEGIHGPVRTKGEGFVYDDGSRFLPFGTTCYAWLHQTEELRAETLHTLENAPFNKIRMCIFPKSMPYNNNDPEVYPFRKKEDGRWDVNDPDLKFWDMLDEQIIRLKRIGIEADLILFHPYDRWGFAELTQEESCTYLRYCIARLSAHSNVWWSLANEYEMVHAKTLENWDEYGEILLAEDPYRHLISIHNFLQLYPKKRWMTHCSVQSGDINRILLWKEQYGLPVVIDECGYEGNIEYEWGNLTGFEMVHRFWQTMCRGGFCTHGETFHREDEVLWWAKGGKLYGESAPRIAFLRELLESLPGEWKPIRRRIGNPNADLSDPAEAESEKKFKEMMERFPQDIQEGFYAQTPLQIESGQFRLLYLGHACPSRMHMQLPDDGSWKVELIDVWNMTRNLLIEGVRGNICLGLPAKEGMALLAVKE